MSTPNIHGRRILLTGANGHIGRVLLAAMAKAGARVYTTDHTDGVDYVADLGVPHEVKELAKTAEQFLEGIDGVVHCAALTGQGSGIRQGWTVPFADQSVEAFQISMGVQAVSSLILMQQLAGTLKRSPYGGSVVIFGSIYGIVAPWKGLYEGVEYDSPVGYSATKGAMVALMRHYAAELAPEVRVNMLTPGGLLRGQDPKFIERYESMTPLGRMGKEEDLVGPTLFLLSDMSRYMTGHNLICDGGWSTW